MKMKSNIQKFENWKTITESDYLTMFIKTWFAFVASLRELYPEINVFTDDGKARGDRPFTNTYKENHLKSIVNQINITDFTDRILGFYILAREKIAMVFPQYFFESLYRINENYHYVFEDIDYIDKVKSKIKKKVRVDISIKGRYKLSGGICIYGNYYNNAFNETLRFDVNLKDCIKSVDLAQMENIDERKYLSIIYDAIYNCIRHSILEKLNNSCQQKKYSKAICNKIEDIINNCLAGINLSFG